MDREQILTMVDHTLLAPDAVWEEIREVLDDAITFHTASACIPPTYVRRSARYVQGKLPICTVIGFPSGCHSTAVKLCEMREALEDGADEIDMVINVGQLKDGQTDAVEDEILQIRKACEGKILKVIIETCLLTQEEKLQMCQIVTRAKADYIKTSTGFSKAGATFADVALLAKHVGPEVKVKAAGGISSFADAEEFIRLGASRLGTSRLVKLMK